MYIYIDIYVYIHTYIYIYISVNEIKKYYVNLHEILTTFLLPGVECNT